MSKVGFIGLGIMGRPMAKNLLKGGVELLVCDLNEEAVKEVVDAGAEAGSYAQIGGQCSVFGRKPQQSFFQGGAVWTGWSGFCSCAGKGSLRYELCDAGGIKRMF